MQTLSIIAQTGIVPVYYDPDVNTVLTVIKVCCAGGIRAFEFTNRGPRAHEIFRELAISLPNSCPELALGAGTILDAPTAELYIELGADFIVAPNFNPEVAKLCNRRGILYAPGCGTVTEICNALEAGCDLIKIFPAGCIGGPAFVKDVLGPLPFVNLMATGSVEPTKQNLTAWAASGVTAVGMGSKLLPKDQIAGQKWREIATSCMSSLEFFKNGKQSGTQTR